MRFLLALDNNTCPKSIRKCNPCQKISALRAETWNVFLISLRAIFQTTTYVRGGGGVIKVIFYWLHRSNGIRGEGGGSRKSSQYLNHPNKCPIKWTKSREIVFSIVVSFIEVTFLRVTKLLCYTTPKKVTSTKETTSKKNIFTRFSSFTDGTLIWVIEVMRRFFLSSEDSSLFFYEMYNNYLWGIPDCIFCNLFFFFLCY